MTVEQSQHQRRRDALPRTIGEARREFLRRFSPRVLVGFLAAALIVRMLVGSPSWWDLLPGLAVLALQPFLEWTLHVFVLHGRPRQVGPWTYDTVVAQDHRAHHADPRDVGLIFIPRRWVGYLVFSVSGLALALGWLSDNWGAAASFLVAGAAMAFAYEWSHFLMHTDYKPRSSLYRHLYMNHRLHHFRNERYWFGITSTAADSLLGTAPEKDAVPVSPTARNITGR